MSPTGSSRWCPTPEQLMILEEIYRGGTRTPNASQIQQITAHLAFYGKIEGKNVFYWFQNHKARDRQKLRRKLMSKQMHQQHVLYNHHHHNNYHHLNYLEAPPACVLPPLSHYSRPVGFLPQVPLIICIYANLITCFIFPIYYWVMIYKHKIYTVNVAKYEQFSHENTNWDELYLLNGIVISTFLIL